MPNGAIAPAAMLQFHCRLRFEHGSVWAYTHSADVADEHVAAMRAHPIV